MKVVQDEPGDEGRENECEIALCLGVIHGTLCVCVYIGGMYVLCVRG